MNSWEWPDRHLLVTVRNSASTYAWLLRHVSQEEFMEVYIAYMTAEGRGGKYVKITNMSVTDLTPETFEMLEPHYKAPFLLEG